MIAYSSEWDSYVLVRTMAVHPQTGDLIVCVESTSPTLVFDENSLDVINKTNVNEHAEIICMNFEAPTFTYNTSNILQIARNEESVQPQAMAFTNADSPLLHVAYQTDSVSVIEVYDDTFEKLDTNAFTAASANIVSIVPVGDNSVVVAGNFENGNITGSDSNPLLAPVIGEG